MTTALFLLRCFQNNINLVDLELLEYGMVLDIFTEKLNDSYENYTDIATQEDFDNF